MTHVSIIGTGNTGQAIASLVTRGGHTVQLIGETDTDEQVNGDIVVLAVPFPAIGDVLTGRIRPPQCPAFGTRCTPEHPLGAPMVSSEGACSAYFNLAKYRRGEGAEVGA